MKGRQKSGMGHLLPPFVSYALRRRAAPARMGPPSSSEPVRGGGAFLFRFLFPCQPPKAAGGQGKTGEMIYGRMIFRVATEKSREMAVLCALVP